MATKKIFIRSPYNYDTNKVSNETGLECKDPTRTQQHMKDECDINVIVRNFGVTGQVPTTVRAPTYGDFLGVNDFHTAANAIAQANEAFDAMPSDLRYRFHNNPQEFVDFCSDDANRPEAERLGLVFPQKPLDNPPNKADTSPTPDVSQE